MTNKLINPTTVLPGYIRKVEAAQYIGVPLRTLSDLMRRRAVPFLKVSHRVVLFRITDLDRALSKFRVAATGEEVKL